MSRTYEIGCEKCSEALWIGQGSSEQEGFHLYCAQFHLRALTGFLRKHAGHRLIFDDSEKLTYIFDRRLVADENGDLVEVGDD